MDELQSLALTAAFLAATVVAGLALSLVPNVELVTLTVFAAGMVLGPARGAMVGAGGMILYVLANAAVRGFPPQSLRGDVSERPEHLLPRRVLATDEPEVDQFDCTVCEYENVRRFYIPVNHV